MTEKDKQAKIISFINMKGGVGKTSLTVNVADNLASDGKKVLVVDVDPQFNATQALLLYKTRISNTQSPILTINEDESEDEVEAVLQEEISSAEEYNEISEKKETILQIFEPTSLTEKHENPALTKEIKNNLFLIPGDLKLAKHISGDTANKLGCLDDHFDKFDLHHEFDYILIDCPPTWSILTHASLYASSNYIIPSKVDFYSSIGIKLLEEQIIEKLTNTSVYKKTGKQLNKLGIVFTLVQTKTLPTEKKRKDWLKKEFKSDLSFFDSELPYFPSVPTKLALFSEVKEDQRYTALTNAMNKIVIELENKSL